jgi:hypothetical protein
VGGAKRNPPPALKPALQPAIALFAALLSSCAADPASSCAPGQTPALVDSLYFGTSRPQGTVTAAEWEAFVRDEIAPRFPKGFTLLEAQGQWRNADGSTAHEASHILQVAHPDDAPSSTALQQIVERYKQRFDQEAVLRLSSAACVSL